MSTDTPFEQRMLEVAREFLYQHRVNWSDETVQKRLAALLTKEVKAALEQDKKFTYCAYCAFTVPVDADGSIIAEHIRTCEKHPAREWERSARLDEMKLLTARVNKHGYAHFDAWRREHIRDLEAK